MTKLTYETRPLLKKVLSDIKRKAYWRERRMNLFGENRPIDKKSKKLK